MTGLTPLRFSLVVSSLTVGVIARSRVSFDSDWRYHLGDIPFLQPCDSSGFTYNLTGLQCMEQHPSPATSLDECVAHCCNDPYCLVYQWCGQANCGVGGTGCWLGSNVTACDVAGPGWVSFARDAPPPTPPPVPPCDNSTQPCSPGFPDAAWRQVATPHDFIVEGAFSPDADRGHGYLPFNVSWYRKHFTVDAALQGSLLWVSFDGVYRNSDMWLNGVYLGHHNSGYTSFHYYLHNASVVYGGGDNVLVVRADAFSAQEGWFYEGGGITRHVWLESADPLSIPVWGVYAPSAITGPITSGPLGAMGPQTAASALVMAATDVTNARTDAASFTLTTTVTDPDGAAVGSDAVSLSIPSGGFLRVQQRVVLGVAGPVKLWNTESRPLYTVTSVIAVGGAPVDTVVTRIGVRDAIWTANTGFMLNGFKVPAAGFSNHQDFGGCGTAVPDRVNEFRVTSLRNIGSNFWRTAHNPVASELLDYCDEYGMLVWDENRFINPGVQPISGPRDPPLPPTVAVADPGLLRDAQDMVLRDRNHPSVVIWSLCNEGGCEIGSEYGGVIGAQFKDVISFADTSRPITANSEWKTGSTDTLTNIMDVMTCSYTYETYTEYHLTHPWKPIMGGESASCTSDRGYYRPTNSTTGHVSSDDSGCVVSAWASAALNPWDSGNFAWTGHDYKGEPTPMNWPCVNSHFGVLDLAGFEKDSAGYYRSWWRADGATFLKVVPSDWTSPVPVGQHVNVHAFTGAAAAEAFVNGVSLGVRNVSVYGYADFGSVPFAPGNLTAVAYDATGVVVATSTVLSVGAPAAVHLTLVPMSHPLAADGADVVLVTAAVVDAAGAVVPGASNLLTFTVTGPGVVYGLANGDPSDHTPDKVGDPALPFGGVWARPAFMGLARAIVQSVAGSPGSIQLAATSPGLTTGTVTFASE